MVFLMKGALFGGKKECAQPEVSLKAAGFLVLALLLRSNVHRKHSLSTSAERFARIYKSNFVASLRKDFLLVTPYKRLLTKEKEISLFKESSPENLRSRQLFYQ